MLRWPYLVLAKLLVLQNATHNLHIINEVGGEGRILCKFYEIVEGSVLAL